MHCCARWKRPTARASAITGAPPGHRFPSPSWIGCFNVASDARQPAVLLMGPTASGKTAIAVELATRFPFEIVNVDSAQIYRHMDIGTAKPDPEAQRRAPHHLIDIVDPTERYSAARFCEDANQILAEVYARGNVPLLTGGTMLYFK